MAAWEFTFITVAFVWVKQNKSGNGFFFGLGHWTRSNVEICLLGVKGRPKRISKRVHQLIVSPLEGHSKKPGIARDKIVELNGRFTTY
ncbi:MT-A70 family methyltransferase [Bacillus safensis]